MAKSSCCGMKSTSSSGTKDVVCGMDLEPTEATLQVAHKGKIYYFCSTACKSQFVKDPEKYVG